MVPPAVAVVILHIGSAVIRVAHAESAGDMVIGVLEVRMMGARCRLMVSMVTQ